MEINNQSNSKRKALVRSIPALTTPEHWHVPMAIMAAQPGKNVYVDKPCSHNPYEGELLIKTQQESGGVIRMRNQKSQR